MIHFRPFEKAKDYRTYEAWCKGHDSIPWPEIVLPRGWVAHSAGIDIACSFLYMDPGKIGVVELTTTNPACAMSRDLVEAVKGLYLKLEEVARNSGCLVVISFVKPRSSEERIMSKMGYGTSDDDTGHRLFAKPLHGRLNLPEDGVLKCPSRS